MPNLQHMRTSGYCSFGNFRVTMYKVSQGPSKFTVQSRRSAQQVDPSFEQRNGKADPGHNMSMQSQPVPTFQHKQNPRRRDNNTRLHSSGDHQFSANHLEIVRMLHDDWKQTERELSEYKREKGTTIVEEHVCKEDNLGNFKPIDIDQLFYKLKCGNSIS